MINMIFFHLFSNNSDLMANKFKTTIIELSPETATNLLTLGLGFLGSKTS